jgi:segregation and condensation protein B
MDNDKLKKVLESLLFVSEQPLTVKRAAAIAKDATPEEVMEAFKALQVEVEELGRSFQLVEIGEGFQFLTRPEYHKWAKELYKVVTTSRLTKPALEALAIIAYKQPVTRAEVEAIRGVDVANMLQTLLEKKMIRILGRAEAAGRPLLYGTTHEFLIHFGLKDLSDLPRISEIQDLAGNQLSPELMKEMEGELRRRETKLGLPPMNVDSAEAPIPHVSEGAPAGAPSGAPAGEETVEAASETPVVDHSDEAAAEPS